MLDFKIIRDKFLNGPRLNSLMLYFEKIASGNYQSPITTVYPLPEFLEDKSNREFCHVFMKNMGAFFKHAVASIPFVLEEHCRVSIAIIKLARIEYEKKELQNKEPFTYYEISAGDGATARSIGELSQGLIKTLSDTPNKSNLRFFNELSSHNHSMIYLGPFADITPDLLMKNQEFSSFKNGFDIILEPLAFQMYGENRNEQIAYVRRVLKRNGLFILMEKLIQDDDDEYFKRELQKDHFFKMRYFSHDQIIEKEKNILHEMRKGQVNFKELSDAIKQNFKYAWMIWNSANFYGFVGSDDIDRLELFISLLGKPYVEENFIYEPKPVMKRII